MPASLMSQSPVTWGLFLVEAQMLHVTGLFHFPTVDHRRLLECLANTQLLYDAGLLEFALEFLKRPLNVFSFFNLYDYHINLLCSYFLVCRSWAEQP